MTLYILITIFCVLAGFTISNTKDIKKRRYLLVCFGLITFFSAIRNYTVGRDLEGHYYQMFSKIIHMEWNQLALTSYDTGFAAFYKLIGSFTKDPQWMIAIHAIFVFSVTAWFIYRNSDDVRVSTFLFIVSNTWFMYLNVLRQAIAISIVLIAVEIWKTEWKLLWKWIIYLSLIIFATTMHSSAIIFVFLPFLFKLKFKRKEILGSILVLLASFVLYNRVFNLASRFIGGRRDFAEFYAEGTSAINIISIYGVLINLLIFALACYVLVYRNKNNNKRKTNAIAPFSNEFLLFMGLLFLICRVASLRLSIMGRMTYYFGPYLWILFPRTLENMTLKNNKKVIKITLMTIMFIAFVWIGFQSASLLFGTVPYQVFWR